MTFQLPATKTPPQSDTYLYVPEVNAAYLLRMQCISANSQTKDDGLIYTNWYHQTLFRS